MASPKALILQGILGVAGLCASSAAGIGLSLDKAFGGVQGDAAGDDSSQEPKPEAAAITKVVKEDDLGIPKECDSSCSLSAEQLKKLKFKQKGDDGIAFEGLEDSDEFELLIEVTEDETNYPKGKKYTLRPKTIAGPVTIKNIKEGDIVLEGGKEVLIRETISGKKLEHLLEEVNGLGIPKRCVGEQATQPCGLTKLQLQKLKFEARSGEAVKVEGQNEGNIVTLRIEDKKDDLNNYPHGKKYTLTSNGYVMIVGIKGGDITLENNQEILIRETSEGGKLEHLLEELNELGIPKRCVGEGATQPCGLKQKQLKDLKFEAKEGSQITVDGLNEDSKFELIIEDKKDDEDNYPKGKKYTIRSTGTSATIQNIKEGDIHIWEKQSIVIRETSGGGKLEMAPVEVDELGIPRNCEESCSLNEQQIKNLKFETKDDEEITVEGIKKAKTVELKVEDRKNDTDNYPKGKKYILNSSRTGQQVTIRGLKDGDIEIGGKGVVIREKQEGGKLEIAPEEIDHLRIPERCNTGATCHLTKEELQRIKFEERSGSSISVEGLEEGTVGLKVETEVNVNDYPKKKKYTFTSKSRTVTIQNTKDGNIVLEQNKAVVFRETNSGRKLETYLNVLGIPRPWGGENIKEGSDPQTYYFSSDKLKDLQFENFREKTGEVKVEGLDRGDGINLTISWDGDTSKYPDNRKYSFDNTSNNKNIKISKGEGDVAEATIAKQRESWFKNENGQLVLVDTKDKGQIAKENELTEVRRILKELGLEKLQIGDLIGGNSKKRQQTNFEFKSAEDLKKIQFKELGGGSDSVSSLGRWGIRVYLDWEKDESKFPKNMKITFENQIFEAPGFEFKKGYKSSVVIYKKELKNNNSDNSKNIFKLEKQNDKWYLVRS